MVKRQNSPRTAALPGCGFPLPAGARGTRPPCESFFSFGRVLRQRRRAQPFFAQRKWKKRLTPSRRGELVWLTGGRRGRAGRLQSAPASGSMQRVKKYKDRSGPPALFFLFGPSRRKRGTGGGQEPDRRIGPGLFLKGRFDKMMESNRRGTERCEKHSGQAAGAERWTAAAGAGEKKVCEGGW